jgi:hypothetical protein
MVVLSIATAQGQTVQNDHRFFVIGALIPCKSKVTPPEI